MDKRLKLILAFGLGIFIILVFITLRFHGSKQNGTLSILYNNLPDQNGLVVSLNNRPLTGQNLYQDEIAGGSYTLVISKPGYKTLIENIKIIPSQTTTVNVNLMLTSKPSADDLSQIFTTRIGSTAPAILSSQLPADTTIISTKYFDNQTWALVTINIRNSSGIAYFVDTYNKSSNRWELVASPSDDFDSDNVKNMPLDVQQYIKNNYYVES